MACKLYENNPHSLVLCTHFIYSSVLTLFKSHSIVSLYWKKIIHWEKKFPERPVCIFQIAVGQKLPMAQKN